MRTIREFREERGWTQLELANKIGVTPGTIYAWEKGKYEPKARQLRALAEAFAVPMEEIALDDEDQGSKIAA